MPERGQISPRHWMRRGEIWHFYGRIAFFWFSAEARPENRSLRAPYEHINPFLEFVSWQRRAPDRFGAEVLNLLIRSANEDLYRLGQP